MTKKVIAETIANVIRLKNLDQEGLKIRYNSKAFRYVYFETETRKYKLTEVDFGYTFKDTQCDECILRVYEGEALFTQKKKTEEGDKFKTFCRSICKQLDIKMDVVK